MGSQGEEKKPAKPICVGLLAHVDAGKTTLSEALLYTSGSIRKMGRVDNQDAFLDTYDLERARGITIFSKQAVLDWDDFKITLLDTPGHVDFSTEMERTLQVLDYAILLISGADGVQAHTQTLWRLLQRYQVPVFIFINKMDQYGTDAQALLTQLQERLDSSCIDFSSQDQETFYDALAMCSEEALDQFLEQGTISHTCIQEMIKTRKVIPCYFGSALKLTGVREFLEGFVQYVKVPQYPSEFAAKVFKIARDEQGKRLTYLKMTGGTLKVRDTFTNASRPDVTDVWEEKVSQIRIYSGAKFEAVSEASAGTICAVTGLTQTKPGEGYGAEKDAVLPVLEPVLTYQVILPPECDLAI